MTPPKLSSAQTPRREGLLLKTEPSITSIPGKEDPDKDDSTTDESDGDLQSANSKPLPSCTADTVVSGYVNDSKGILSEPMDLDDDDLTAHASDIDNGSAKTHLVSNSKQRLGKIGGKEKDSSPQISAAPTLKPKLGKIGGKNKLGKSGGAGSVSSQNEVAASKKPEDPASPKSETKDQNAARKVLEPERRSRTVQQTPEPSPPRETSQERANKKREQLKRELESKSQAATKKKRRF